MSGSMPDRTPDRSERRAADGSAATSGVVRQEPIALVDLLDRVLAGGVVILGDVRLSIADVDLVTISLQALISSVSALADPGNPWEAGS
jgi:Gas vesicle protein